MPLRTVRESGLRVVSALAVTPSPSDSRVLLAPASEMCRPRHRNHTTGFERTLGAPRARWSRVEGNQVGNKIKSLFSGKFLAAFGAGFAAGFGVGLLPRVRTFADGLVAKVVA